MFRDSASRRSVVMGFGGAVATSQPLAAQAGLRMLLRGGNAVDAAIATAAVLNVVEPMSTGMGGDAFALIYWAKEGRVYALNASGRAPYAASVEAYARRGLREIPRRGMMAVTVPGAAAGWADAVARFGTLGLDAALQPAIDYAERGFPVSERIGQSWSGAEDLLRQNPWQKTWLYDDVMDVLTLEPQLDSLAPLMRFFESTGDRYLILHTKSDRVDSLIEAEAPANTIIAWSLSGPTQSREVEPLTGTTESRIEAARSCQEAGITIRYKFKPIVPVPNWQDEATYTVDLALARTRPDNLSLTFLMWMDIEALKKCIPEHLLDPEFLQAAEAAADQMRGIHVGPFPDELREHVYRHYLAEIRARDADIPVTICTESLDMWAAMGEDLGFTPGNYVCGCGAGATPNLRALSTSPWQDAQAAVKWDGSPVVL